METSSGLKVKLTQSAPIPLDVEFNCAAGELLALVGPSGSGKTTVLRCIAGLASASTGSVILGGETWWQSERGINIKTRQRRIGMVFQSYGLFEHMTARKNIETAMSASSSSEKRVASKALMELVNLAGLESRMPSQLSGGQRQRVALARALARQPRVLLLDEPFSAVDLITRVKLRKDLARIRRSLNIPIILVTHDLDEAHQLADSMCILHHGVTLQHAVPEDLINRPLNPKVARLIGQTNIFNGTVQSHDRRRNITRIRWRDLTFEASLNDQFEVNQAVHWVVPQNRIILHQRLRPSSGESENPVKGHITDMVKLGNMVALEMMPDGPGSDSISFSVPLHVAERNSLAAGERVGVSLKSEGMHLMPVEDSQE